MDHWKKYLQSLVSQSKLSLEAQKNADRLLNDDFLFDAPYNMEPTQVSYHLKPIPWQESPNGDPEWLFMLKRQEYLSDLVEAYYEKDDDKNLKKAKSLIMDWIEHNLKRPETWRTLDTGIRILNWTPTIELLLKTGLLTAKELKKIDQAVGSQANYLSERCTENDDISNWGVLATTGLLVFQAYFPDVVPIKISEWAQKKFAIELELQVDAEGMQWEESPLYLLEVFRSTLSVIAAYRHKKMTLPVLYLEKAKLMQRQLEAFVKPNGRLVQQGDTDSIRVDRLLNTSQYLLQEKNNYDFKTEYDFLLLELWHSEINEAARFESSRSSTQFRSGNLFWRSDWTTNADFCHVFNGNLGSGHGHAGLGHIDLSLQGQDILTDSGRYTYVDSTERRFLKSVYAHNVLVIDGKPFTIPKDSWKFHAVSTPLSHQIVDFEDGELIRIVYLDQSAFYPIPVTRNVICLPKDHLFISFDQIEFPGKHDVRCLWQIAPDLKVKSQKLGFTLGNQFKLFQLNDKAYASETLHSDRYNHLIHKMKIESSTTFCDFGFLTTVIGPKENLIGLTRLKPIQSGNSEPVSPSLASGFKITLADKRELIVAVQSQNTIVGRKLYWFDDVESYGSLNLFEKKNSKLTKRIQLI